MTVLRVQWVQSGTGLAPVNGSVRKSNYELSTTGPPAHTDTQTHTHHVRETNGWCDTGHRGTQQQSLSLRIRADKPINIRSSGGYVPKYRGATSMPLVVAAASVPVPRPRLISKYQIDDGRGV